MTLSHVMRGRICQTIQNLITVPAWAAHLVLQNLPMRIRKQRLPPTTNIGESGQIDARWKAAASTFKPNAWDTVAATMSKVWPTKEKKLVTGRATVVVNRTHQTDVDATHAKGGGEGDD